MIAQCRRCGFVVPMPADVVIDDDAFDEAGFRGRMVLVNGIFYELLSHFLKHCPEAVHTGRDDAGTSTAVHTHGHMLLSVKPAITPTTILAEWTLLDEAPAQN
jgi:hypothetical protein